MRLAFLLGILCAITAIAIALQNDNAVSVTVAQWSFESSLAWALIVAVTLGMVSAFLLSVPVTLRLRSEAKRLRRRLVAAQDERTALEQHVRDLQRDLEPAATETEATSQEERMRRNPNLGLRPSLLHRNSF